MPRGGKRVGAGRKPGTMRELVQRELKPKISVPELARRYTHGGVRFLAEVFETGYATRQDVDRTGKPIIVKEPASVALRVHCVELLLERGHGRPHQAIAVADGSTDAGKSLRDLILGAMALRDDRAPTTIDHEPIESAKHDTPTDN